MKRDQSIPLVVLLAAAGCAPQATTEYQGDPMFSLTGRVELPLTSSSEGALIPSIAFVAPGQDEIRFVDAEVQGEFPAQFRIDLYAPPPAEAIGGLAYEDLPGEPRHTIGYISAVTEDHLPTLYYASTLTGSALDQGVQAETQADANGCNASGCFQTLQGTNFDHSHTGTVTLFEAGATEGLLSVFTPGAVEVVARSGDPLFISYASDPMFAGAVTNYAVAYLETDAPANGVVAKRFGSPQGLSAGYHLLRWEAAFSSEAEEAPRQACRDAAQQTVIASYNAAHGTTVTIADFGVKGCNEPGCQMVGEHTRALRGEWFRLMAQNDCLLGAKFTPVDDPGTEPVSLQVQPGLSFARAAVGQF